MKLIILDIELKYLTNEMFSINIFQKLKYIEKEILKYGNTESGY